MVVRVERQRRDGCEDGEWKGRSINRSNMKFNSHVPYKHMSSYLYIALSDLIQHRFGSLSFTIMSSTQPTQPAAHDGTPIPEGFAIGTTPDNGKKYLMPEFMVPAYEYSLLIDGSRAAAAGASGSAETNSTYDGSQQEPAVGLPADRVSILSHIHPPANYPFQLLRPDQLVIVHRWVKAIQKRDGISYDQACNRLYSEQFEILKVADEDTKAWKHLGSSVNLALFNAEVHRQQDSKGGAPK